MRILVCGDRYWLDAGAIRRELDKYPRDSWIIHGGARGADSIAGKVAKELGFKKIMVYQADWNLHGRAAGPIRNQQMLNDGKPDIVLAFHPDISNSKGTLDMINRASRRGLPVYHFMN